MFRLNLKISLRNLWKNGSYTAINIGGLAIALAAFILVVMYVRFETSFDHDVAGHDRIYLVGRSLPDSKTNFTPPPLAKAIKDAFPEIEAVGRSRKTDFEFAFNSDAGRIYGKEVVQVDYDLAKMFDIKVDGGLKKPGEGTMDLFVPQEFISTLYPTKVPQFPALVSLGPKNAAQSANISGIVRCDNSHTNLTFDALVLANDIGFGQEDYTTNNFNTYIRVKEGTDIAALQAKIDAFYKQAIAKAWAAAKDPRAGSITGIFLDPLDNLHLKPVAGSDTNYKTVIALSVLGLLVMVIACINFTNLTIAQTNKRAKEVGVKKVLGAYRINLMFQFLIEIFLQCLLALILGLILAEILLPLFNGLFQSSLSIWKGNNLLIWQLPLILVGITLISGVYPALVLSGFQPAAVLKGNLQTSYKTLWMRNALLVTQFSIAIIFIAGLLIVSSQLKYMRTEDTGFKTGQVVYIKSIVSFNRDYFDQMREKIMKIPGVNNMTVVSDIPDGSSLGKISYAVEGKSLTTDYIDADYGYFETLNLNLKEGRFFSSNFKSDAENGIILNETAVARYGLTDPVGKTVRGCDLDYRVVGVVKDFKAQGFERTVEPTMYMMNNPCGNGKLKIMVNIDEARMAGVLATLKRDWKDINRMDSDDFRYEFLDQLYGRLFKKQEQLQAIFYCAAILTIFIAILGLFAFSAFTTNNRIKEISIRKVLGATDFQILKLLNSYFVKIVLVANLIGWPLAYIVAKRWLDTFAYRIEVPLLPFVLAGLLTTLLTIITVSIQARNAVKANPVDSLKYE